MKNISGLFFCRFKNAPIFHFQVVILLCTIQIGSKVLHVKHSILIGWKNLIKNGLNHVDQLSNFIHLALWNCFMKDIHCISKKCGLQKIEKCSNISFRVKRIDYFLEGRKISGFFLLFE